MNQLTKSTVYLEFSDGNTMEIEGGVSSFEFTLDNKLNTGNSFSPILGPRVASCSMTFDLTPDEVDAFRIMFNTKPKWYKRFFNQVRKLWQKKSKKKSNLLRFKIIK
jgi:hypothetical protein